MTLFSGAANSPTENEILRRRFDWTNFPVHGFGHCGGPKARDNL
jgi:hypothetical protein